MSRRTFLILGLISLFINTFLRAFANAKIFVIKGKLGYKLRGPASKQCSNCKHYLSKGDKEGICRLKAMQVAMKTKEPYVFPEATCNMWIQGSK